MTKRGSSSSDHPTTSTFKELVSQPAPNFKHPLETYPSTLQVNLTNPAIKKLKGELPSVDLSKRDEEKEHSLEMHMPYIRQAMGGAKVVPIIVGDMKTL